MPVTNAYDGNTPTVGADADAWGGELNTALAQIDTTLDAYAVQINENEIGAEGAVQKAGDTMAGDLRLADVAPFNAASAGFRGVPAVNTDQDRTFVTSDSGKMVRLFGTNARTWTIPINAFPVNTVIVLRNYSSANLTVARGSVALALAGTNTNANATIAPFGYATLVQEDVNLWFISGVGVS